MKTEINKQKIKQNKSILLLCALLFFFLALPIINAESNFVFKLNEKFILEIPMKDTNFSSCWTCTCNISIFYPNGNALAKNVAGTNIGSYCQYNDTSGIVGIHEWDMSFSDGTDYGYVTGTLEITPTGLLNNLGFYILILLISIAILILGFAKRDVWITLLGTFGLYFIGLYILFYGITGTKDLIYTWGTGIIILGVAMYISVKVLIEFLEE